MKSRLTVLGQLLQIIPRYEFQKAIKKYETEKSSKGFSSWSHFVAMLFCQLCRLDSLRGIVNGINSQTKALYHLGIEKISRSTLSYANTNRSHRMFGDVFYAMLGKVKPVAPKHKFRFKNPLYSLDSTTIDLCLSLYDWAKFRKRKGGVKLHLKLNHSGYIPSFAVLSMAKTNDVRATAAIGFKRGDVVVFDRGYNDYELFATYCIKGIYFVTRLKKNAKYRIVARGSTAKYKNISSDHIIELYGYRGKDAQPLRLRKIRVKDPESGKWIMILTNQFSWSSQTIASVYKDRWQIEIFFKAMKQRLKIKSFVGTTKNALLTQITAALIVFLLLAYLKFLSTYGWTIYSLTAVLPAMLFCSINLWAWLNYPFEQNIDVPENHLQLELL